MTNLIDFLRQKEVFGLFTLGAITLNVTPVVTTGPAAEAPKNPGELEKAPELKKDGLTAAMQRELYGAEMD